MTEKKLNILEELEKSQFLSNNQTIMHTEKQFAIDFTNEVPNIDSQGNLNVVKSHKVILLEPLAVKVFFEALKENIRLYEEKFGKINAQLKQNKEEVVINKSAKPTYFG